MQRIKVARIQRDNFIQNKYGDDQKWQEARQKRLAYDGHKCTHPNCNATTNLQVHHVIEVSKGGSKYSQSNLRTLCISHHVQKHRHLRK